MDLAICDGASESKCRAEVIVVRADDHVFVGLAGKVRSTLFTVARVVRMLTLAPQFDRGQRERRGIH